MAAWTTGELRRRENSVARCSIVHVALCAVSTWRTVRAALRTLPQAHASAARAGGHAGRPALLHAKLARRAAPQPQPRGRHSGAAQGAACLASKRTPLLNRTPSLTTVHTAGDPSGAHEGAPALHARQNEQWNGDRPAVPREALALAQALLAEGRGDEVALRKEQLREAAAQQEEERRKRQSIVEMQSIARGRERRTRPGGGACRAMAAA